MDGTACLIYYLASLEAPNKAYFHTVDRHGAIVRGDQQKKEIALIFSAHDFGEGGNYIADVLKDQDIKGSFFLTGDFYRNNAFKQLIKRLVSEGHYLGAHSDKHLLYNDWNDERTLLVSEETFKQDLRDNYAEMEKFGIEKQDAYYFLPPYEWYDEHIALWTYQEELALVNFTAGTLSHTDYTTPDMGNRYRDNKAIYQSVMFREAQNDLNGYIMLVHLGTDPARTEKFYHELPRLITELKEKGYDFVRIDGMLDMPYHTR
ncbi:MAG: polysaccharide deacetylase family protein, partial [FCB group bacterium]|nr:polysaccharide deacetylase family protein [FCB group bacterium]